MVRKRTSWGRKLLRRKKSGELEESAPEYVFCDVSNDRAARGVVDIRLYAAARPVMLAGEVWALHRARAKVFAADGRILCKTRQCDGTIKTEYGTAPGMKIAQWKDGDGR